MPRDASELARGLAQDAEAVCRYYLSNGRRQGRYWMVGDVQGTPGRSMYVRLSGPEFGPGGAGRWTDAASSEHGDLLDVIRESCGLREFRDVAEEARRFLSLPRADPPVLRREPARKGPAQAARRLWVIARPIADTLAEAYLHNRGIMDLTGCEALRFHPRCWYRGDHDDARDRARDAWPALISAVTALDGTVKGVHRTWLDPATADKAPIAVPRKAMGRLRGYGVWIGAPENLIAAGEGLETVLSLRVAMPTLSVVAGLSAGNLATLILPPALRRLYIAVDDDRAGRWASERLLERARAERVDAVALVFPGGDANDALQRQGIEGFRASLRPQLCPEDVDRLLG